MPQTTRVRMSRRLIVALSLTLAAAGCSASATPDPESTEAAPTSTAAAAPTTSLDPNLRAATDSAEAYLLNPFGNFSKSGLIARLVLDGVDVDSAIAAVEGMTVDWKKQAERSARFWIEAQVNAASSFDEMVQLLVSEGFTAEEAEYGTVAAGLSK